MSRRALVVSTGSYLEGTGLRNLAATTADATALAGALGDPTIGGFEVTVVQDQTSYEIVGQLEDFLTETRSDDVLLLHFSCHGLKNDAGELYLTAVNTRPERLTATGIASEVVDRLIQRCRARTVVLFLDCCFGGAYSRGMTRHRSGAQANVLEAFPTARSNGARNRAVITASSDLEYAFEGDTLTEDGSPRPSLFTEAVVQGLTSGEADTDEDGWVSLDELYDYVFDRVQERNPLQTPSRAGQTQGDVVIARSRRAPRTVPIPAELTTAITSPDMFARRGAVIELGSRLLSEDLLVASSALEALTRIAREDLDYVASAARAELSRAAIRLEPASLEVESTGRPGGTVSPVVRILGPPLGQECTITSPDAWLRVARSGSLVTVLIDVAGSVPRVGGISFAGPLGTTFLPVSLLAPSPEPTGDPAPSGGGGSPGSVQEVVPDPVSAPGPASRNPEDADRFVTGPPAGTTWPAPAGDPDPQLEPSAFTPEWAWAVFVNRLPMTTSNTVNWAAWGVLWGVFITGLALYGPNQDSQGNATNVVGSTGLAVYSVASCVLAWRGVRHYLRKRRRKRAFR